MGLQSIKSRQAIFDAIQEFNQLGREAFLAKYGFRHAQRYFLEVDGSLYDSKAIIGVAYGYEFPKEGALRPIDFSGGEVTVKRKLEELGFKVRIIPK